MTPVQTFAALPYLPIGALLGWAFFASLQRVAELYAEGARRQDMGPRRIAVATALQLARLAVAGVVFWVVARQGALPLAAALLGFLLARHFVVRRAMRRLSAGR